MDIRELVEGLLREILQRKGQPLGRLELERELFNGDWGLDSLDFAELVVALEEKTGVDPFMDATVSVQTLGDLLQQYERATKRNG